MCLLPFPGRSLLYFGLNFIKNIVPSLCPRTMLEPASLALFQREYEEMLYRFPEIMWYLRPAFKLWVITRLAD
jgi:hypothetical protein